MKRANEKWIEFKFDKIVAESEALKTLPKSPKLKETNYSKFCGNLGADEFNLLAQLKPKDITEVAVHSKKIQEVETWLMNNIVTPKDKSYSPMLLITGPTGSGKTTTLTVLCKKFGVEVNEWINPIDSDYEILKGPGQTARLSEFLMQSKYQSVLSSSSNKKLTLIEDFPNSIMRNPKEFLEILEKCYYNKGSPIAFICTEVNNKDLNLSQTLFNQEVKDKFNISCISFNSCSNTLLKHVLKNAQTVIKQQSNVFKVPSADIIDAVIASSMGDIRCAINQYYFACLQDTEDLPFVCNKKVQSKAGTKRKRNIKGTSTINCMTKNETLGLFHGLGRVLNPKRQEVNGCLTLQCDIDALIDEFGTQPKIFNSFLHENYFKYFGDLNDVCRASKILSDAQLFLDKWTDRYDTLLFALWLSVLGLMVYNEHKVSKWNQIKGPTKHKKMSNSNLATKDIHVTDYAYYNIITKTNTFHIFK